MSLQETDEFLVQRGVTPYKVDTQNLMTKVQDDDLLIVSRATQSYKITGLELKGSFGSGSINPGYNDITINPPVGGSGTEQDPYILQSISASPYGSTVQSVETITIIGQAPAAPVIWKDNSVGAGTRFSQITGITNAQGEWSGKLEYADIPDSTADAVYVGKLQIGLVHYQWTVSQFNVIASPTSVTSVSLIEADPAGDRFTSQSFVASSQVVDGVPTSVKTLDAHVDGTLSRSVKFTEPLESSTTGIVYSDNTVPLGGNWQEPPEGAFQGISPATQSSYVGNTAWIENVPNSTIRVTFANKVIPANGYVDVWTWSGVDITVNFHDENGSQLSGVTDRTESAQGNANVKVFRYSAVATEALISKIDVSRGTGGAFMSAIDWNGTFLSDQGTTLTFANGTDMSALEAGDDVSQGATSGTVASITGTTASLSSSSGSWANGSNVTGPQKTIVEQNARLYCAFDSNGNVTDLQTNPQDPPYTTTGSNPGLTFTFPATFPSGKTPDEELPDGTTFTVEVTAANATSTDSKEATVQPEPAAPPAPLAGLTTLYPGLTAQNQIINGIDCVNNEALVWFKARGIAYPHFLFDTVRGGINYLDTNTSSAQNSSGLSTAGITYLENGVQINQDPLTNSFNANNYQFVNWTFGKAAGYFDVVTYTGNGTAGRSIAHNLGRVPGSIWVKNLTDAENWVCYHRGLAGTYFAAYERFIQLNQSGAAFPSDTSGPTAAGTWGGTAPDADNFYLGGSPNENASGKNYVAYLFAEDTPGVIKCGSYTGDDLASHHIDCGFDPQWVMIKNSSRPSNPNTNWLICDSKRPGQILLADTNDAEVGSPTVTLGVGSNGFTVYGTSIATNVNPDNYIYIAIAAPPAARSQTDKEFVETTAKFLTYDNRKQVKEGEDASAARVQLVKKAENLGLTTAQIEKVFKNG